MTSARTNNKTRKAAAARARHVMTTAPTAELALVPAGNAGLSTAQLALLSQGAQRMRRVQKVGAIAVEETSRIQEYGVFKMLSTASSIKFLTQAAELGGGLSNEGQAFVRHLNQAWLAQLAEIIGTSIERIVELSREYGEKEPGFREFVVALVNGEIEV